MIKFMLFILSVVSASAYADVSTPIRISISSILTDDNITCSPKETSFYAFYNALLSYDKKILSNEKVIHLDGYDLDGYQRVSVVKNKKVKSVQVDFNTEYRKVRFLRFVVESGVGSSEYADYYFVLSGNINKINEIRRSLDFKNSNAIFEKTPKGNYRIRCTLAG